MMMRIEGPADRCRCRARRTPSTGRSGRSGEPVGGDARLLRSQLVQQEEDRRRRVDRHRRRDAIHRNAVEQPLHVLDGIDRDAGPADLALGNEDGRSRSPSGWGDRTRRRARSGRDRGDSGSARWSPRRRHSRVLPAWSRVARGTSSGTRLACTGRPLPRSRADRTPRDARARRRDRSRCRSR